MLSEPDKRCGCGEGHETFGQCLRAKNVQIDKHSLKVGVPALEKRKDHTLSRFRQCVKSGVTPQAPTLSQVEKAEKVLERG